MDTSVLMPTIVPDTRLHVVVGILRNAENQLFVQQRLQGKPREGQWEFPGGKVEKGESAFQALGRELHEELGIMVLDAQLLTQIGHDYEHANVWLDVFKVVRFGGEVRGCEGQNFRWCSEEKIAEMDVLEAVFPILQILTE